MPLTHITRRDSGRRTADLPAGMHPCRSATVTGLWPTGSSVPTRLSAPLLHWIDLCRRGAAWVNSASPSAHPHPQHQRARPLNQVEVRDSVGEAVNSLGCFRDVTNHDSLLSMTTELGILRRPQISVRSPPRQVARPSPAGPAGRRVPG